MCLNTIKPMTKKTVMITGGHLSPVLTIIPELKQKGYSLVVVGRLTTFNNIQNPSLEYQLLSNNSELVFYPLKSGRFTSGQWHTLPLEGYLFIKALWQTWQIFKQQKPNLVLSFGGYLSLPVCLVAKLKKIPIRLHEQTICPGRANLLLSQLADKIFVSFPESVVYFPKNKTVLSGIGLRAEYAKQQPPTDFKRNSKPLLLVMGGSSGSHSINVLINNLLPNLINSFQIVHQTGDNQFKDYKLAKSKKNQNYYPVKYLLPENIGYFYHQADLVVSRSGANTFFELIKFKLPAILVPLPWSANQEQQQHAQLLAKHGVAKVFNQNQSPEILLNLINNSLKQLQQMEKNYQNLKSYARLIKKPSEFVQQLLA